MFTMDGSNAGQHIGGSPRGGGQRGKKKPLSGDEDVARHPHGSQWNETWNHSGKNQESIL